SLVVAERDHPETRYRLLETLREYGEERLGEHAETDTVRTAHAEYYTELAALLRDQLSGPDQIEVGRRFVAEHENFHAAMNSAIPPTGSRPSHSTHAGASRSDAARHTTPPATQRRPPTSRRQTTSSVPRPSHSEPPRPSMPCPATTRPRSRAPLKDSRSPARWARPASSL